MWLFSLNASRTASVSKKYPGFFAKKRTCSVLFVGRPFPRRRT